MKRETPLLVSLVLLAILLLLHSAESRSAEVMPDYERAAFEMHVTLHDTCLEEAVHNSRSIGDLSATAIFYTGCLSRRYAETQYHLIKMNEENQKES